MILNELIMMFIYMTRLDKIAIFFLSRPIVISVGFFGGISVQIFFFGWRIKIKHLSGTTTFE
jgi:hypothetical protein